MTAIDTARKRPVEFQTKLNSFIEITHRDKLITDYGGIDIIVRRLSS